MRDVSLKILLILMMSVAAVAEVSAEDSWWEKVASVFKEVDGETLSQAVSVDEIETAFKEALDIGVENVVTRLSMVDGFNGDAAVHIPLPSELQTAKQWLGKVGLSYMVDDLEVKLNRAAETAAPKARDLFLQSISEMSFEDVKVIYEGPEDSATRYFQSKMTDSLSQQMKPIIEECLSQVGAVKLYDDLIDKYEDIPFVPDIKAELTDHVVQKGIEGIFFYMAKEEAAIRQDPVKQTTELLKKVFSKI